MAQNGDSNQNENLNGAAQQHENGENGAAQQHEMSDLQNDDLQEYYRTSKIPFIIFLKDLRYIHLFVLLLTLYIFFIFDF